MNGNFWNGIKKSEVDALVALHKIYNRNRDPITGNMYDQMTRRISTGIEAVVLVDLTETLRRQDPRVVVPAGTRVTVIDVDPGDGEVPTVWYFEYNGMTYSAILNDEIVRASWVDAAGNLPTCGTCGAPARPNHYRHCPKSTR